jgi:predicted permease
MGDVFRDLQYSVRMLAKSPMFTIAAVMTLALGIGMNAATFSAVNSVLLAPLGGTEEPEELVQLYRQWPGMDYGSNSIPHYQSLRDMTDEVFEDVATWTFTPMSLSTGDRSERQIGMAVSANFFQTYGAVPILGRAFLPGTEDVGPGAHPVIVLGYGFWQSRFGGDPAVVGTTVTLNGYPFEVVGVAPEDFWGPVNYANVPLFAPLMMQRELVPGADWIEARGSNMMNVVGRLHEGQTIERASQVMDAVLLQLKDDFPENYEDQVGTTLVLQNEAGIHPTFRDAQVGMSTVIMVVVALLLLIACVNVANLFLARARERRREMGIRLSLGASRRRILQQLLTESLVFSLLAGVVGLGIARLSMKALIAFRPPMDGPFDFAIGMDNTVLMFTLWISLAAGFVFGLAPALQAASPDTVDAVKGESSQKGGRSRLSSGLVIVQMALSLLLLISSGLFLRSLQGATEIDPGFEAPQNLVMASVDPGLQGYDEAQAQQFFDRLVEELEAVPEVTAVGLTNRVPLGLGNADRGVEVPGYEFAEGERQSLYYAYISEGYVEAMGIELLEGRTFNRMDDASSRPVIIVNKRFADRFWPGQSALGKTVSTAGSDREVIGVVETGKYTSLGEDPAEYMYMPHRERFDFTMTLVARTPSNPQNVLRRVREVVRGMDPDLPLYDVRSMENHMGIALLPARIGGSVLGAFGILGLILAAVGIYGVMAYSVAQRTRELGIRVALGASTKTVLTQVMGEGMRLAMIGTVIGLVAAAGAARLVSGLLYNVSAIDPVAFVGVPAVLVGVAALAVLLPARRAASVEPMKALKTD